jgi:hypothetical protein
MRVVYGRRVVRDLAVECTASTYENSADKPVSVQKLHLPSTGSPIAAWRLTIKKLNPRDTFYDIIFVQGERALVQLNISSIGSPPAQSLEKRLVDLTRARLRAGSG